RRQDQGLALSHHTGSRTGFGRHLRRGIFWGIMSTHRKRIVLAWGSAALLAATPVGAAPSDSSEAAPAGPSEPSDPADPPNPAAPAAPAAAAPEPAEAPAAVGNARGTLERGITELGTLLTRARQSGDSGQLACVQDKRDRAEIVLEV